MRSRNLGHARRHVVATAALTMLALASCSDRETPSSALAIGSGDTAGGYSATATAIARVVNGEAGAPGLRVENVPTAGSIANVEGVLSGDLAFGLAQGDVVHQAASGQGHWEAKGAQVALRAVFSLYTEAVTVVARPDSGIRTLGDVRGKRIDIGHPDSGGRRNALDILVALGADWRSGTTVHEQKAADRSAMYLAGELDAFIQTVGHPNTDILFAVNSSAGARLVGLDHVSDVIRNNSYYSPTRISVELYPGIANDADVMTVGVKTVLVTSASTPDETVYALTRAVFADLDSLGKFDPVLRGLSAAGMTTLTFAPLHAGAERYYREAGLLGED